MRVIFYFKEEEGMIDAHYGLEFRRVLFRSHKGPRHRRARDGGLGPVDLALGDRRGFKPEHRPQSERGGGGYGGCGDIAGPERRHVGVPHAARTQHYNPNGTHSARVRLFLYLSILVVGVSSKTKLIQFY